MRFHTSSTVDSSVIDNAATVAGVTLETATEHRSRTHDKAWEIKLSGNSSRMSNGNDYRAATFDEWGVFIEMLYRTDPLMSTRDYFDYHHFVWTFGDRYAKLIDGTAKDHKQHKWSFKGFSVTNSYSVQECTNKDCSAILRRVTVRYYDNEKPIDSWHRLNSLV